MATVPLILIHWGGEIVFLNRNEVPEKNLRFFVAGLLRITLVFFLVGVLTM